MDVVFDLILMFDLYSGFILLKMIVEYINISDVFFVLVIEIVYCVVEILKLFNFWLC